MLIIAHRGASRDAPENTLAAARLAWAQGADALEVDVQLTNDNRLAVIHDLDTARTAGVHRVIAETSLAELQQLDVGCWKDARFIGEKIPALEDMFALVPPGKRLFVEIKGGPEVASELQRCIALARHKFRLGAAQVAVISFNLPGAAAAKRALPDHEVCWIADSGADAPHATLDEIVRRARSASLDGIDVEANWPLDREAVQQVRREGINVYVWTVDDAKLAQRFADAGVDGIATNRPGWLRAQIAPQ